MCVLAYLCMYVHVCSMQNWNMFISGMSRSRGIPKLAKMSTNSGTQLLSFWFVDALNCVLLVLPRMYKATIIGNHGLSDFYCRFGGLSLFQNGFHKQWIIYTLIWTGGQTIHFSWNFSDICCCILLLYFAFTVLGSVF